MEWNSVRYFLAVARQGGLTAASREMNVSVSTVSRNLSQLEDTIGVPLFVKHPSGYTLTTQGESLLQKAVDAENALLGFESVAIGQHKEASGVVRLATAENIATNFIIPALPNFYHQHPLITLDLATGIASTDIARRDADIAIRLSRPENGNVLVRKLGTQQWAFYRSKQFEMLEDGHLNTNNSSHYPFIFWAESLQDLPVPKWLHDEISPSSIPIYCSSLYANFCAAKAGLGIALLPCFMGDIDVDLEYVPYEREVISQDIWLAVNREVRSSARVSVVVDFLTLLVEENKALLEGKYPK